MSVTTKSRGPTNVISDEAMQEVASAAVEASKQKAADAGGPPKLIWNSNDTEIIKGNQYPSGGWVHGPAYLEMFRAGYDRLNKVAEERNLPEPRVSKVRLCRVAGHKVIYFVPTTSDDVEGIQVTRYKSSAWINLISLLGPANLTVRTGHSERFALEFAGADSPVGPALVMDMGRKLGSRRPRAKKRARTTPETESK